MDKRLGSLVDEFKELVYPPDYNPEEKVPKRKQGKELGVDVQWVLGGFFWFCFALLFFLATHAACRILVHWPGIEPGPSAVNSWSPNHWTAREFPVGYFLDHQGIPSGLFFKVAFIVLSQRIMSFQKLLYKPTYLQIQHISAQMKQYSHYFLVYFVTQLYMLDRYLYLHSHIYLIKKT